MRSYLVGFFNPPINNESWQMKFGSFLRLDFHKSKSTT